MCPTTNGETAVIFDLIHMANARSMQLGKARQGFTLIELLVVMAIIATLLSIVAPRYFDSIDRAKEATLKTNLRIIRESIDKYRADTGHFPDNLQTLVSARYLQSVPVDPVTDRSDTWAVLPHPDGNTPGVYNIHSSAPGTARDGSSYASW